MAHILVTDDEGSIRQMLGMHLQLAGHSCVLAQDAGEARAHLEKEQFDLALVDIMMPGEDGFSLAQTLVARGIPVLFLTARTQVPDRVKGLQLGADDYILKPFEPAELLARIGAVLRRTDRGSGTYQDEVLTVDYAARTASCKGERISLTALEFDLLALLTRSEGRALSRETLLAQVWGYDYAGETRTVDVHVQRLRSKIGADAIETVYKYGYRYVRRGAP